MDKLVLDLHRGRMLLFAKSSGLPGLVVLEIIQVIVDDLFKLLHVKENGLSTTPHILILP